MAHQKHTPTKTRQELVRFLEECSEEECSKSKGDHFWIAARVIEEDELFIKKVRSQLADIRICIGDLMVESHIWPEGMNYGD